MDPCPFVLLLVGNLSRKFPSSSRPSPAGAGVGVHPFAAPCYCKIRLNDLPYQTSSIPLHISTGGSDHTAQTLTLASAFHLAPAHLDKLPPRSVIKIAIFTGRRGSTCGVSSGKLLGKVDLAELRQKLQSMETLEKVVELLRRQKAASEQAALSAKQRQSSGGVWGWLAGGRPNEFGS